ncbi:hypothetical protein niasHT_021689 [Heterodera trifolii]|uniref:F-box domain-containing protein n=2 Tax=Heterodera trifolii TaxID=157864 RepID=A0ABD2KRK8_9BILA
MVRCMRASRGSSKSKGIKHMSSRTQHAQSASKRQKLHNNEDDCQWEGCSNGTDSRRKMVGINDLPHPVLGLILANLNPAERLRAESVCHRWKFVGSHFSWTNQRELTVKEIVYPSTAVHSLFSMSKPLTNKHIEILLKRCGSSLRLLNIGSLSSVNRDSITYAVCSLFVHVPMLHTLDLSGIQLTNSALSSLGFRLSNLKRVAFRNSFKNTRMERGLSSFLASCRRLTHLDLSGNENLIGTAFSDLPPSLEELNISYCYHIGIHGIRQIRATCGNLRRLYMDQIGDSVSIRELDEMLRELKSLVYLKFCDCYGSSEFNDLQLNHDQHLTGIGELTNLMELHVNENRLVDDEVLRAISFGCTSLQFLDISQSQRGITDAGLRHLSQLPNLTTLKMNGQRMVSDESLILIARRGILRELTISRCTQITSESVLQTIKHCKNLGSLDVSYCVGVTQIIFAELNKAMERRHGKNAPSRQTRQEDKFRLTICRSGIQGNVPSHSPWIHLVDYPPNSENSLTSNAVFITAHLLNIPMIAI